MPEEAPALQVHAILPRSRANGPGVRWSLWVQGCSLRCPGCFNPATHPSGLGISVRVRDLLEEVRAGCGAIEGITVSGGEPLEQPAGILALLDGVRRAGGISTLLFSGFRIEEIARRPLGREILARLDVLVDGRYEAALRDARGLRGSSNQRVHLLTPRYTSGDVEGTPVAEAVIKPGGTIVRTGLR